jgi:hypothetical protein
MKLTDQQRAVVSANIRYSHKLGNLRKRLSDAIAKAIPRWVHEPDGPQTEVPYEVVEAARKLVRPDYHAAMNALFEHEAPGYKLQDEHPYVRDKYLRRAKAVLDSQLKSLYKDEH